MKSGLKNIIPLSVVLISIFSAAFSTSSLAQEETTPLPQVQSQGQAEFIVAKHRNGGLDNIRLKFIGNLGKFDNLDEYGTSFDDLPSKMNMDAPFLTKNLPSANDAFGSNMNSIDDDSDVPF